MGRAIKSGESAMRKSMLKWGVCRQAWEGGKHGWKAGHS
jgi:hypothetical protein